MNDAPLKIEGEIYHLDGHEVSQEVYEEVFGTGNVPAARERLGLRDQGAKIIRHQQFVSRKRTAVLSALLGTGLALLTASDSTGWWGLLCAAGGLCCWLLAWILDKKWSRK